MNKPQGKENRLWVGALLLTMAHSLVADAHASPSMSDADNALANLDRQDSQALSYAARMLEQPAMTWDKWIAQEAKNSFSQRGPRTASSTSTWAHSFSGGGTSKGPSP